MLRQRLIVAILLVPPGLVGIWVGGWWFLTIALLFYLIAAYEYTQMMQTAGHRPAMPIVGGGVVAIIVGQSASFLWPESGSWAGLLNSGLLVLLLTLAVVWHLIDYERGAPASGTDWAVTVAGMVYLGWMGSYTTLLRALPDGREWTLVVLPAIWLADSGAYFVGKRFGKHQLSPRLSPKKTWEGFVGGIVAAILFGGLFAAIASLIAPPGSAVGGATGAIIGLLMGVAGTLGDLGISMFKRQAGVKDSGAVLGAHGGLLDRIDSWIIAIPLAYFVIKLFFQ